MGEETGQLIRILTSDFQHNSTFCCVDIIFTLWVHALYNNVGYIILITSYAALHGGSESGVHVI